MYLEVSDFFSLSDAIRPERINLGYCSGNCEKRPQSLRQTVFHEGSDGVKKIEDIKEFLDLEKDLEEGCCVPKSYHMTSLYNPNDKYGEIVKDIKRLKVKSCHCVYL